MSKRKNISIVFLLALLVACVICASTFASPKTFADTPTVEYKSIALESKYELGYNLSVPEAEIDVDGTKYPTTGQTLTFPNGKVYSDGSYVLSVPGKYVIKYSATVGGKTVYATDEFTVNAGAYSVSGTNSSAYYGNTGDKGNLDGIIVTLSPGDVFTYEKVLDIRDKKKADKLLNLYALPEHIGVSDATSLYVRITDAYDENNFVEVATFGNMRNPDEVNVKALYQSVRANNQTLTGAYWVGASASAGSDCVLYDGQYYAIRKNITSRNITGYTTNAFSFSARNGYGKGIGSGTAKTSGYTLSFDYEERKVYGSESNSNNSEVTNSNGLIADLDDSLFFENLWNGFTNGEVKISIYVDNYINSSFSFVVTEIFDEDLTATSYGVTKASEIVVDYPSSGGAPNAISNQPYKIFDATAYSTVDGVKPCKALVYKDYYSSTKKFVNVNADGEFIPTDANTPYHIVYSYTDTFGNTATEVVEINVIEQSKLAINLKGEIEQGGGYTGQTISLKTPEVIDANGDYTLKVLVGIDELSEVVADKDGKYSFLALKAGDYTVKYLAADYTSEKEESYSITVNVNPNNVAITEANLPVTFVKGASYVLPELTAYTFTADGYQTNPSNISYKFDDGALQSYVSGSSLKITASSTVTVNYGYDDVKIKEYVIPVTDVGLEGNSFRKQYYFYGDDFTKAALVDGSAYSTSTDNATLHFIKPLLINDFTWEFGVDSLSFNKLNVTLTDAKDNGNALTIKVEVVSENEVTLQVNDGEIKKFSLALASGIHTISYQKISNTVTLDEYSYDASDFKGFNEYTANMQVKLEGVTRQVTLSVYSVNGASLNSTLSDYAPPTYYLDMDLGSKALGEYIVVSSFYVEDVIRFNSTKSLTITDALGNVCVAEDGTVMNDVTDFSKEYRIRVTTVGEYEIKAKIGDGYNESKLSTKYVYGVDKNAPVIRLAQGYKTTCAKGSSFSVAKATVSDNIDKNLTATVMVMNPYGKITILGEGVGSYVPAVVGTYTVMYRVVDSDGNVTNEYYEVTVK